MEYLCKIHFYRNCTDTVGIFVPPSHFLFFLMQHLLSQNLSPAQDFPTFCAHAALSVLLWESRAVGGFVCRSEYFQRTGVYRAGFTKVHFYVLRCLKMPRILVITIHTAGHYQFQNGIDLSTYPTWTIRQKSHRAKVTKVYGARATGRTLVQRRLTLEEPQSGDMDLSSLLVQKGQRWGARSCAMKFSITWNMSMIFLIAKGTSSISGLGGSWADFFVCLFVAQKSYLLAVAPSVV